jgi:NDP-sugar pyrophosphorylase family protein
MKKIVFEQAVIFAGGRGERLRPLTDTMPKPMAPVLNRPFLDYLLKSLTDNGIKRILILAGYRADSIINYYGNCLIGGMPVSYSVGAEDELTGRRLLNAYKMLDDHFLLLYGDNYWNPPLPDMIKNYESLGLPITTTIFSNKNGTGEYGKENNAYVGPDHLVHAYDKSRKSRELNGVDIGFFLMDRQLLDPQEEGNISFEEIILSRLVKERKVGAFLTDEQYYYITSMENLQRFEDIVKNRHLPHI